MSIIFLQDICCLVVPALTILAGGRRNPLCSVRSDGKRLARQWRRFYKVDGFMRCFFYLLIICIGAWASVADASEVLSGTVVAIDRDHGRITLKIGGGQGQAASENLVVTAAPEKIPGNISPGDTIRVWGESSGKGAFRADSIRKRGSGGSGSDPTGVRSRLGQGGGGQGTGGRQSGRR